jgi:hypothetical protein
MATENARRKSSSDVSSNFLQLFLLPVKPDIQMSTHFVFINVYRRISNTITGLTVQYWSSLCCVSISLICRSNPMMTPSISCNGRQMIESSYDNWKGRWHVLLLFCRLFLFLHPSSAATLLAFSPLAKLTPLGRQPAITGREISQSL